MHGIYRIPIHPSILINYSPTPFSSSLPSPYPNCLSTSSPSQIKLLPYFSPITDKFIILENALFDPSIGEHPDTLAVIVVIFKHPNVILATGEEDAAVSIQLVVFVEALVDLIIIKHFATNTFQEVRPFTELSDINLIVELHLPKLQMPVI